MYGQIIEDEHDAQVAACYDADAPRTALCWWCRGERAKLGEEVRRAKTAAAEAEWAEAAGRSRR